MVEIACKPLVAADSEGAVGAATEFRDGSGYFLVQAPTEATDGFFGASHYVEVCSQAYGAYGGLRALRLSDDGRRLSVVVDEAPPELGAELELVFDEPTDPELAEFLKRLEI